MMREEKAIKNTPKNKLSIYFNLVENLQNNEVNPLCRSVMVKRKRKEANRASSRALLTEYLASHENVVCHLNRVKR